MKTVNLNVAMTYPIRWNTREIFRDYIQNFYDALGPEHYFEQFHYSYDGNTLVMKSDISFDYDWLLYMGTSTKQGGSFAGRFGEGFKIASLCACRDKHYSVTMESKNWRIRVIQLPGKIEEKQVYFLGYEISDRPYGDDAVLTLAGVSKKDYAHFEKARQAFYYPENKAFGRCIVASGWCAVYETADGNDGSLYISLQKRAKLRHVPLIFCHHKYKRKRDDRDRKHLYSYEAEEAIKGIVQGLDGASAYEILIKMQPFWMDTKNNNFGMDWGEVVELLVISVFSDPRVAKKFKQCFGEKIVADYSQNCPPHEKRIASLWYTQSGTSKRRRRVQRIFSNLGIPTIDELCRQAGGFSVERQPTEKEQVYISLLKDVAENVFKDLICYDSLPACTIIANKNAVNAGQASVVKKQPGRRKNSIGLKEIYQVQKIALDGENMKTGGFAYILPIYMHELLHQFGGDSSMQFRWALLAMDQRILEKRELLKQYEEKWDKI